MLGLTKGIAKKFEQWERTHFFEHECINESNESCNPVEYFRETSHFIDMTSLYKVVSTCYNNDEMKYMPILVQIQQPQIRKFLGGFEYLLQVWEIATNKKIYQLELQQPVKSWSICNECFIFTLCDGNDNSDSLFLVNVTAENKTLRVSNFTKSIQVDHIIYKNNFVYVAHNKSISVVYLTDEQLTQDVVDISSLKSATIDTEVKIWGIVQLLAEEDQTPIFILESTDNQLDFNYFDVQGGVDGFQEDGLKYLFMQAREKVPRKRFVHDPIRQAEIIVNNGNVYAVATRESAVDLYYNMKRTESSEKYKIKKLVSNIKGFLFEDEKGEIQTLYHRGEKSLSCANIKPLANKYNLDPLSLDIQHIETIKNNVKFYESVAMIQETYYIVFAHESFLSFYDALENKFVGHLDVGSKILLLFEMDMADESRHHCMLLQNGEVKKIDFTDLGEDRLPKNFEPLRDNIEDKIVGVVNEKTQSYPVYIITEDEDGDKSVQAIIQDGALVDIRLQGDIGARFNLVPFLCKGQGYLLVQMDKTVYIYKLSKELTEEDFILTIDMNYGAQEDLVGNINSVATKDPDRHLIFFDEKNGYILKNNPFSFTKIEKVYVSFLLQDDNLKGYYALKGNDNDKNDEGYFYLDVDASVEQKQICFINIAIFDVKTENVIYKGFNNSRLGFFQSLYSFVISIIPNMNMNKLYCGIPKSKYIIYKQIKDMIIVQDDEDYLLTWDVVSGKRINKQLSNVSLKGFAQYNPRGYKTTLMYRKMEEDEETPELRDYFEPWQLETYTTNQQPFRLSSTDVTFHLFKEVEIISEKQIKVHLEYVYPVNNQQYVYLISNSKKDLVITRDSLGWMCLFKPEPIKENSTRSKLQIVRTIQEFTPDLHVYYKYRLDFFSPEFSKFLAFNPDENTYNIIDTFTGRKFATVPQDLMNVGEGRKYSPQMVINRFEWIDERIFRICGEEGLEKLVDVEDDFKEISFNQIPLFNQIDGREWQDDGYHIYKSRQAVSDPVKRFKRNYQDYKSKQFLFKNTPRSEFNQLLFQQDFEDFDSFSHSFSLLNWNVAKSCQLGMLSMKDLSEGFIEASLYAVFPGGNTLLHYLYDKTEELEILLNRCHPNAKSIKYHVPIIQNGLNETVLSMAVGMNAFKTANNLLKHLSLYPADHHSRAIQSIYPALIKLKLPDFDTYMESRLVTNPQLEEITKLSVHEDFDTIQVSTPWLRQTEFRKEMSNNDCPERKVKLEILDISGVYHYNDPDEDRFFDALAQTDQFAYFELRSIQQLIDFNYPIVQKYLIWRLFVPYFFFLGIYNFMVFHLFDNRFDKDYQLYYWIVLGITNVFATYFFMNEFRQMRNDGLEYFKSVWNYLDTLPILGIYVILAFSIIEELNNEGEFSRLIQRSFLSIVTLLMWLKFLYFFRLFDATSYLIRAVVEVVISMRHFMLVLLFTIIGFGNAFYVISKGNEVNADPDVENFFISSYLDSIVFSYRMVLGDFDTAEFGELAVPLITILFILFTIFNMIVMLNLLIAIISDAYAAVAEVSEQAKYQERATMIAENNYLIPEGVKVGYAKQGQFLLVITDLEKEEKATGDDVIIQKIDELKTDLNKQISELRSESKADIGGINTSVEQLQLFLLDQQPKVKIFTKLFSQELTKMTLIQVRNLHEAGEYNEWGCCGQNYNGCYNDDQDDDGCITKPESTLYRCDQCGYEICEVCYDNYGEPHIHPLVKMTLADLQAKNPDYALGFVCDANGFDGCQNQGKRFNDKFSVLYHNVEHSFEICQSCADIYKIEVPPAVKAPAEEE